MPSEAPQTQTQEGERGQQAEGYFGMGKSHLSSGTQGSWVWIRMQGTGWHAAVLGGEGKNKGRGGASCPEPVSPLTRI